MVVFPAPKKEIQDVPLTMNNLGEVKTGHAHHPDPILEFEHLLIEITWKIEKKIGFLQERERERERERESVRGKGRERKGREGKG